MHDVLLGLCCYCSTTLPTNTSMLCNRWKLFGSCLGGVWACLESLLGGLWGYLGTCLGRCLVEFWDV